METKKDALNFRKNLGLTQEDFAARLGVTANYISLIENGAKPITPQFLQKISNTFKESFQINIKPQTTSN